MDSVRSLYSYAQGQSGDAVIGLNRYQERVRTTGKAVPLMSAIADIGDDEGWSDDEMQMSAGPQSSSRTGIQSVSGNSIEGTGYRTKNGSAFASRNEYEDRASGEKGSLVVFNTRTGSEQRLVPLYS